MAEKLTAGVYIVEDRDALERLEGEAVRAKLTAMAEHMGLNELVRAGDIWGKDVRPEDADSEQYLYDGWRVTVA